MIENITPIGFRVLINIDKNPMQTSSGLFLPEQDNMGIPVRAKISVLGKKTWWQKFLIFIGLKQRYKIGQEIYFKKYSLDELKVITPDGDLMIYILEEDEINALINE